MPKRDILFLETEYQDWCVRQDVETKSLELLIKEICYQQLAIQRKKEKGASVATELKTLQELMNSSALKPIQESALSATGNQTFGTLIKKWEDEKPIPKPDKEFEDVNNIREYIKIWFSGHLCKMLGKQNESSDAYEAELLKYTVEIPQNHDIEEDADD